VNYVVAGYAIALGALFLYAFSLLLRRRRWERALKLSQPSPAPPGGAAEGMPRPGEPS
jgi:uncharacterized protein (TIGR03382 family)